MNNFAINKEKLLNEYKGYLEKYEQIKAKGLSLNLSRGRPCAEQLALTAPLLVNIDENDPCEADGIDCRNYVPSDGLSELKGIFAPLLDVEENELLAAGNSSLNLMFDIISDAMFRGFPESEKPWGKYDKIKFLCPAPGYDRHFAICEYFGIEMIPVDMTASGPDMDTVETLVASDDTIKGIWCVPKYSNPQGITYSDETVRRFARLSPKAKDFRIFWDNAYFAHEIYGNNEKLLSLLNEAKKANNANIVIMFASTSKITYPGAGVSFIAASKENISFIKKRLSTQLISFDKINQLRHARFLKSSENLIKHMKLHAEILRPKFDIVCNTLEKELSDLNIGSWHKPNGGYFVSLDLLKGTAKRTWQLTKEAGVTLTQVGATFPYGLDPNDSNIRIAPTYVSNEQLQTAMDVLCLCAKIAAAETLINA